jgi:hypothetical protein
VHEVVGVLFERGHSEEVEFVVGSELVGGARHDHGRQLLVALVELLDGQVGDGDEVGVEVFGVADDGGGVYDVDKGLGREVARPFPLSGSEGALGLVVLGELGLDVVVDALDFLRTAQHGAR